MLALLVNALETLPASTDPVPAGIPFVNAQRVCGQDCGVTNPCGEGCTCDGWQDAKCVVEPPQNTVQVDQCPTKHSCQSIPSDGSGSGDGPCDGDPEWFTVNECSKYTPTFNGTSRQLSFACVGTHLGKGNITIKDCTTSKSTTVPNNQCVNMNGQWNLYSCEYESEEPQAF